MSEVESLEQIAEFWSRVDHGPIARCWPWRGHKNAGGYGIYGRGARRAHRIVYRLAFKELPDDKDVLHRCDQRDCCNPSHFFLGDNAVNVADMMAKGREARGDKNGARCKPEFLPRGETHGMARLTNEDVVAIRVRCSAGERQRDVARDFGIAQTTVGFIARRETWRHIK